MAKPTCAYCGFSFGLLAMNADEFPEIAPIVCESCAKVGFIERGVVRRATDEELAELKQSPAWRDLLAPAINLIEKLRKERA